MCLGQILEPVQLQDAIAGHTIIGAGRQILVMAIPVQGGLKAEVIQTFLKHPLIITMDRVPFSAKRYLLWLFLSVTLIFAFVSFYHLFKYYPLTTSRRVFARLASADGSFLVIGKSNGPLDGWDMRLYVMTDSPFWAAYYLDHESRFWDDVRIENPSGHIQVYKSNQLAASLDIHSLLLNVNTRHLTATPPIYLIMDKNPFNDNAIVNPGDQRWPPNWPMPPLH